DECIGDLQHYGCDNDWLIRTRLREFLQTKLDCRPGVDSLGGGRMLALVGPPGSGKTTTLAKLAAQAALVDDRKVLTISTDCRRIGAIDQARKFCQIIGVAFEAPQTPEELQQAI